jgi:hypothetical protein
MTNKTDQRRQNWRYVAEWYLETELERSDSDYQIAKWIVDESMMTITEWKKAFSDEYEIIANGCMSIDYVCLSRGRCDCFDIDDEYEELSMAFSLKQEINQKRVTTL